MNKLSDLIQIDNTLVTPVYKQIVQSICRNIENGILIKGDVLPSVNKIASEFSLARGSVFTAYNDLRASGIIDSIPGKGYFVFNTETKQHKRIFLLLSTLSPYKEILFNALVKNLSDSTTVNVYFHFNNRDTFENLIRNQTGQYNIFIVEPNLNDNTANTLSILDPKKTFLLDSGFPEFKNEYAGVYQNAEKDIYATLLANQKLVAKYKRLFFITADEKLTKNSIAGFKKFCKKTTIIAAVKNTMEAGEVKKGDGFIIMDDDHLVELVNIAKLKGWQFGKDIGVLSYNENALKSIIGAGITTISKDLKAMGQAMANMISNRKKEVIENPFIMIDRKSF